MNMSIQILLKWIDHMGLYENLRLLVGSRYQHEETITSYQLV